MSGKGLMSILTLMPTGHSSLKTNALPSHVLVFMLTLTPPHPHHIKSSNNYNSFSCNSFSCPLMYFDNSDSRIFNEYSLKINATPSHALVFMLTLMPLIHFILKIKYHNSFSCHSFSCPLMYFD